MTIYIPGLGDRNPINDSDQIVWFFNAYRKSYSKRQYTKLLLDVYENYLSTFVKNECFEMLAYLRENITDKQIKRRVKWNANQMRKWEAEGEKMMEMFKKNEARRKAKEALMSGINLN